MTACINLTQLFVNRDDILASRPISVPFFTKGSFEILKCIEWEARLCACWELLQAAWLQPTLHGLSAAALYGRCHSKFGPGLLPGTGKFLPLPQRQPHHSAPHWPLSVLLGWMSICEHIHERVKQLALLSSLIIPNWPKKAFWETRDKKLNSKLMSKHQVTDRRQI